MRWLAVIALCIVGLFELAFRAAFTFLMCISIVGLLIVEDQEDVLKPVCFDLARQIVENSTVKPKHLGAVQAERDKLLRDKLELQELLLRSEITA